MIGANYVIVLCVLMGGPDAQDLHKQALQAVEERDIDGFAQAARQIRLEEGDPAWLRLSEGDLLWWIGRYHEAMEEWGSVAASAEPHLDAALEERRIMASSRRAYEQRLRAAERRARSGAAFAATALVLPWLALLRRRPRP
mgnify:CR=1 FL=1